MLNAKIAKLSLKHKNGTSNTNSNKSFSSRSATKTFRTNRLYSTSRASPAKNANMNETNEIYKLKSELSVINNLYQNEKNKNAILTQRNKNLRNCLLINKNKCELIKLNYSNKNSEDYINREYNCIIHSLFESFFNIIESFIMKKNKDKENIEKIKEILLNQINDIRNRKNSNEDDFAIEIDRINSWNNNIEFSTSSNESEIQYKKNKLCYHTNISNPISKEENVFVNIKNVFKDNDDSGKSRIKTYLIKKPKNKIINNY